jgi:Fe-S-cluster formation regulator IscX/YfhJ
MYADGSNAPQSVESEMYILYCLLIDIERCKRYNEFFLLKPEYFYKKSNKTIFESIIEVDSKGYQVDILSVINELEESNKLKEIGGAYAVYELSASIYADMFINISTTDNFVTHYRIICDKYRQREMIEGAIEIVENSFENVDKSRVRLENLYDKICELENEQMFANRPLKVSELNSYALDNTVNLLDSRIFGVPIKAGEMTVITSKSGSAKTTYASALLVELANAYPFEKFYYYWKEDTVDKYLKHFKHLKHDNVFFDKNLKYIDHLPNEIKKNRPKAIIIDGFGLFEMMPQKNLQSWELRDKKAIMLSNIAMEYQVALILTAQYNDGRAINFQREMNDANIGSSREVINSCGRAFEIATVEPNNIYPVNNLRKIICLKNRHKYDEGRYSKLDDPDNYYYTHCYFNDYQLYNLGKNILINESGTFVPIN